MSDIARQRRVARQITRPSSPYTLRGKSAQAQRNRQLAGAAALGVMGAAFQLGLRRARPGFISLFRNVSGVSGKRMSPATGNEAFWAKQETPIWKTRQGRTITLGELWGHKNPKNPDEYLIHRVPLQTRARRYIRMKAERAYVRKARRATLWNILGYDNTWKAVDDMSQLAKDKIAPAFRRVTRWVDDLMAGKAPQQQKFPPIWTARRYATGVSRRIERTANRYNRRFQHQRNRLARAIEAKKLPVWPAVAIGGAVGGGSALALGHMIRQERKYGPYREPIVSAGLTPAQSQLIVRDNKFVHDGLVHTVARRFAQTGMPYDDIVQAGRLGLVEAARKFDPSRGKQFSTYAVPWVRSEIQRARGRDFPIRLPERKIGQVEAPAIVPIQAAANVIDAERVLSPSLNQRDAQRTLRTAMNRLQVLSPAQQAVMRERYFSSRPQSAQDIAKKLGITPGRVSQLEKAARKRLQRIKD